MTTSILWREIVEVTRASAKQSLLELLDTVGFTATSWQAFSIPAETLEMSAHVWSELSKIAVFLKEAFLNETAAGEALTRFSKSQYDNTRLPSVAAQRTIQLTCSASAGPHTITLGALIASDAEGHTFRNIEGLGVVYPVTLPAGGTVTLLWEAERPGIASSVGAGSVTQLVTTLAGVTLTDLELTQLGADEESDTRLRLRNATKWALLSEWELTVDGAIQLAIRTSQQVATVGIDDQNPRGAGTFDVYIAGAVATSEAPIVALVQEAFDKRVLGNVSALVKAAPVVTLGLVGTIYHESKYDSSDVQIAVQDALTAFVAGIPLGGFDFSPGPSQVVPINDIESAIRSATLNGKLIRLTVVLTSPAGNLAVPSFGKVTVGAPSLSYVPTNA